MLLIAVGMEDLVGISNEPPLFVTIYEYDPACEPTSDHISGEVGSEPTWSRRAEDVQPRVLDFNKRLRSGLVLEAVHLPFPHANEEAK